MATAETAVAMPVLVALLGLGLSALTTGADQVRCVDAARAGARLLARGEAPGRALAEAQQRAPEGARVQAVSGPTEVTVTVTATTPRGLRWLGVTAQPSAAAVAAREDTAAALPP